MSVSYDWGTIMNQHKNQWLSLMKTHAVFQLKALRHVHYPFWCLWLANVTRGHVDRVQGETGRTFPKRHVERWGERLWIKRNQAITGSQKRMLLLMRETPKTVDKIANLCMRRGRWEEILCKFWIININSESTRLIPSSIFIQHARQVTAGLLQSRTSEHVARAQANTESNMLCYHEIISEILTRIGRKKKNFKRNSLPPKTRIPKQQFHIR